MTTAVDTSLKLASANEPDGSGQPVKTLLKASRSDWTVAILFLLSIAAVGLHFFPAYVVVIALLINRFFKDRYDFLLMVAIMATSPAFLPPHVLPVKLGDPLMVLAFLGLFFFRKSGDIKRVTIVTGCYVAFMVLMTFFSDESFAIQFLTLRQFASILTFILPLWLFANREFDFRRFYTKLLIYFLVIMAFYMLDGFILQGYVLVPASFNKARLTPSVFWALDWAPFGNYFPRKYPAAMMIVTLAAYPLARYYKLKWWQWAIICLGFAASRTMSVIGAFFLALIIFQGQFKRVMTYMIAILVIVIGLYFVDSATGEHIRIASTINQFTELSAMQDREDLSNFGSTRMAQVIPKYEALVDQHCLWKGFGFIHPTKTTLSRYQIDNDLYSDITMADETAAMTEVNPFNTILMMGIIGLLVQLGVFFYYYFIVKNVPESGFYMSGLITSLTMSMGGFGGLNSYIGLIWVALGLAVPLLLSRPIQHKEQSNFTAEVKEG